MQEEELMLGVRRLSRRLIAIIALGVAGTAVVAVILGLTLGQKGSAPANSKVQSKTATGVTSLPLGVLPGFSIQGDSASHVVAYQFTLVNEGSQPILVRYSGTGLPPGMSAKPATTPQGVTVPNHGQATLTIELVVTRCIGSPTAGWLLPLDVRVGPASSEWSVWRMSPPGSGPGGDWQREVFNAVCAQN